MKMKFASYTFPAMLICGLTLLPSLGAQAGQPTPPPKRVHAKLDGFELSANSGKSANQIGGASRDLGSPQLYAPRSGKSFSTHPVFYWAASEPGAKVMFRLMSLDGTLLYEATTTDDHLKYPDSAAPLTPGASYRWTIKPENDLIGGAPAPVTVVIVSGPEREQIATELSKGSGTAAAGVFVNHRVWYDAVDSYSTILTQNPNDQDARRMRAELYDQLPSTKVLAEADWNMVH
jgi:hypothetical protein